MHVKSLDSARLIAHAGEMSAALGGVEAGDQKFKVVFSYVGSRVQP